MPEEFDEKKPLVIPPQSDAQVPSPSKQIEQQPDATLINADTASSDQAPKQASEIPYAEADVQSLRTAAEHVIALSAAKKDWFVFFKLYSDLLSPIFMTISTCFIAWYTYHLSEFSRQQTDTMNNQYAALMQSIAQTTTLIKFSGQQTKYSLSQSESALIQADEAIKANTQALYDTKKQSRAYVVYENINLKNFDSTLILKNAGQTPAINLTTHFRTLILDRSKVNKIVSIGIDLPEFETDEHEVRSVLGSNSLFQYSSTEMADEFENDKNQFSFTERLFSSKDIGYFTEGNKAYLVIGAVYYDDVYSDRHRTRICFYFIKNLNTRYYCDGNNDVN